MLTVPSGVVPVRELTTSEVLHGDRKSSYRWEVLTHSGGDDHLLGTLDGVVEQSASLEWQTYVPVKGSGKLKVADLDVAQAGYLRFGDLDLSLRLRPVLTVDGLPEIPWGVFLISKATDEWSGTGRVFNITLLDRSTVLAQDKVSESYTVDASTGILAAVKTVIESAGESINVDADVTDTLAMARTWPVGTSKLQIVNDLLDALNYNSLWVDGLGQFRATPHVVPAERSLTYELLNVPRELVDGEQSIYEQEWTHAKDMFGVPNKVIAVQAGSGDSPALTGTYTNTDPDSPFSYPSRGNRWLVNVLEGVDTPDGSDAEVEAFLEAKARASLIASSSVQAVVEVSHLPVPVRVSDVMRFSSTPAGVDARHVETTIRLDAHPLGLMRSTLQEVVVL